MKKIRQNFGSILPISFVIYLNACDVTVSTLKCKIFRTFLKCTCSPTLKKVLPPLTGVTTGGVKGTQFLGRRIIMGTPKCLNSFISTFFNTVNFLPEDLRFEHGDDKLASCPGRHLTSLRPCHHCCSQPEAVRSPRRL